MNKGERIMLTRINYLGYAFQNILFKRFNINKYVEKSRLRYGGHSFISASEANAKISKFLSEKQTCAVARIGSVELLLTRQYREIQLRIRKEYSVDARQQLCQCAGFFPNEQKLINQFAELMIESLEKMDLLGVWYNPMENYFVSQTENNMVCTPLVGLEPWYYENPWSKALKGKKVLVIHPFSESIERQYKYHDKLFPNNMIPDFDLHIVKAVQTIAGQVDERFDTWFEALEYMYKECQKVDFDVAIIGCGAYGLPLAAKLKSHGKQVIHLGGATQLMFGIKGKRWDEIPRISQYYNEFWVRPNQNETVKGGNKVENGCYW